MVNNPITKASFNPIYLAINNYIGKLANLRSIYNFDGVDDRGQLQFRAINPDGDIDIEWTQDIPESVNINSVIACQCGTGANTTQEFRISYLGLANALEVIVGGSVANLLTTAQGLVKKGKYRVTLVGATLSVYINGVFVRSMGFSRGTAREPTAAFVVGARPSGSGFINPFQGALCDVRINGVLYPIADRNQAIQLPSPSGLGAELITQSVLENPATKGSTWSYLGAGRWEYVGDGTGADLAFISPANLPDTGFIEYEVESYQFVSGTDSEMRISSTTTNFFGDRKFSSTGVKRAFYTQRPANISFVRNGGVSFINCVIKNISFRPLWVASATELSSNRPAGNFMNTGSNVVSVGAGTELMTNDITVEPYTLYQIAPIGGPMLRSRWQWKRASDQTWQWGAANLDYGATDASVDFARLFRTPVGADAIRIYFRFDTGTITGISIRKVLTACNFLTLFNTASTGWTTVENSLASLRRKVYTFDGVDDFGLFATPITLTGDFSVSVTIENFSSSGSLQEILGSELNFKISTSGAGLLHFFVGNGTSWLVSYASTINIFDGVKRVLRATRVGNTYSFSVDGAVHYSATVPDAVTPRIAAVARRDVPVTGFAKGRIYDLVVNGITWAINESSQAIQLPSPSGLGPELITQSVLENPFIRENQWSYLGNGRWQLVGDGTLNQLVFIDANAQPTAGFLEFEIESITGTLMCTVSSATVLNEFSTPGVKRYFYTQKALAGNSNSQAVTFKRRSGSVTCVIKNISFKPLWVAGSTELVTNGDFSSSAGWSLGANSSISGGVLQVTNTTGPNNNARTVATVNTKAYQLTYRVTAITSGAVRALVYGNGVHYIGPDRTAVGTYTELVIFNQPAGSAVNTINIQAGHAGATTCTVDDVSLRELDSLCNPLTLTNTASTGWQEIEA